MTDLDKAREWAKRWGCHTVPTDTRAVIDLVQSLPDQWVDAEKVQDLIDLYKYARDANESGSEGWAINDLVAANLEGLLAPKLPTLAELIEAGNDPKQYQWMQAVRRDERCVITRVYENTVMPTARLLTSDGTTLWVNADEVTPLPGPKLEWPGDVVDAEIVDESLDDQAVAKDVCNSESNSSETPKSSLPRPEDVPPNEPWLIEVADEKAIGTRFAGDSFAPWPVASLDGSFAGDDSDSDVTLIHKLVPETHTLPEGMRLADHEEYGRVVVSPKVDAEGDHGAFYSNENSCTETGASWTYVNKSKLTFLDGGN